MSVLYTYRCRVCSHGAQFRFNDDTHDGEVLPCRSCGALCALEFDGGVTFESTRVSQSEQPRATLSVYCLMGGPHDIEFLPLLPKMADTETLNELKARWSGRELRSVGIMGLNGTTPFYEFQERMEPEQIAILGSAFMAYLDSFFSKGFAEQMRTREIDELHRIYSHASASQ